MQKEIISLSKNTLIYGLGHNLARVVTFLLLPLYTHTFTQDEYGALSLAYAFMGFALILYRYGMDTALMKYSVQKSGQERNKYINNERKTTRTKKLKWIFPYFLNDDNCIKTL